jgi:hypothetical protein
MNDDVHSLSPAEAAVYGLAAGFAATLLISAVSRIPAIRERGHSSLNTLAIPPAEVSDPALPMSPAAVLVQTSGPGPEGPAGLFAAKVASGLFGRDLATRTRPWGQAVHLAYGSFWGLVYGMLQTRRPRRPGVSGVAHGLFVWLFGPALLVPAMKLMPAPGKASRQQAAIALVAHAVYGLTVASVFSRLARAGRSDAAFS